MPTYAAGTDVPSDRSLAEIKSTLSRYGADAFAYLEANDRAAIEFVVHNRRVRFVVPLPDRRAEQFTKTPTGRDRSPTQAQKEYEQAIRQRWRALALYVKATLEAVESSIVEFDTAFLGSFVLGDGRTVAEAVVDNPELIFGGQLALGSGES
jgi:hypothetical protein